MPTMKLQANGTLLHRQLFVLLRQQIASGHYRAGERLPTQEALCAQFAVSRITVRRALSDLRAAGLIRVEQGSGAYVSPSRLRPREGASLSFVEDMRRVVEETTVKVLALGLERCPPHAAALLGLDPDETALRVLRVRSRGRVPLLLLEAWIPRRFEALVTREALKHKPLYHLISDDGRDLGRIVQEVNAALADPLIAQHLQVEVNAPVLKIERLVHDRRRQPTQFLAIWSTPTRTRMVTEIAGGDLDALASGRLLHDVG